MTVKMMLANRSLFVKDSKVDENEISSKKIHNEYIYFTNIPENIPNKDVLEIIKMFEAIIDDDIWDIVFGFDLIGVSPDNEPGSNTIKFSTNKALLNEYVFDVDFR